MNSTIFDREKLLIGANEFEKITNAKIVVFGIGGVGGYVCEMLVRSGIQDITICDYDTVDITNINRQIIALDNTVGKYKVDVMEERLKAINNKVKIEKIYQKLSEENIDKLNLTNMTYVVDAIDDIHNKLLLIKYCDDNNISIISSMGAGNKLCIPNYIVTDIYKTKYDKLAKIIRQKCNQLQIKKLNVCYMETDNIIQNDSGKIGSISYHPCVCGAVIASYVINEIIKN